jgi:hypothetical protein
MKHLKLTFVGLLALHAPNHRNSSAIKARPTVPLTLADTIGPKGPVRLGRSGVRPKIGAERG